ncbi:MAG: ankyrin repeat domain-containing protein [Candidatus Dependentiae bacterium]|nr:ankyrin repeat domain-containing protein [Candidatus Dependentiae bacterium]
MKKYTSLVLLSVLISMSSLAMKDGAHSRNRGMSLSSVTSELCSIPEGQEVDVKKGQALLNQLRSMSVPVVNDLVGQKVSASSVSAPVFGNSMGMSASSGFMSISASRNSSSSPTSDHSASQGSFTASIVKPTPKKQGQISAFARLFCSKSTYSSLMTAAAFGELEKSKLLLEGMREQDACIEQNSMSGAAGSGFRELFASGFLAPTSIRINDFNEEGESALILAATYGHDKIVQLLLESKAIDKKNKAGFTALDEALSNGHQPCVDLLKDQQEEKN